MAKSMIVSSSLARRLGTGQVTTNRELPKPVRLVMANNPLMIRSSDAHTIDMTVSGLGAYRANYKRWPGKSFPTSRGVNYIDPHDASDKAARNPGEITVTSADGTVRIVTADEINDARKAARRAKSNPPQDTL